MIDKSLLGEIENDPRFQKLKVDNPKLAAKMARIAARKVVQSGLTTGRDPEIKGFLERNLPAVNAMAGGVKEELSSLPSTIGKSFTEYSAIGQVGKGAYDLATGAPVRQQEPIDQRLTSAFDALKSGNIRAAGRNLADYGRERSSYYMPGTLAAGTVGLVGDVVGQVPDIITGAKLGGTVAQGMMQSGVPQRVAGMLSQAGVDSGMNFAATLATTRDPVQAAKAGGVSAVLGGGAGYLLPNAPTAQTQRVIREKTRMAKPAGPGLNVNLASADQVRSRNAARTSPGPLRDLKQFSASMSGTAPAPSEMWTPNVQQPVNRTGRPLPVTEATLETPQTAIVPTGRITPAGPDATRTAAPTIDFSEQAAAGRQINVEIATAELQAARNARLNAERRLDALARSGRATPNSLSEAQARVVALREEEVRLQGVATDMLAARQQAADRIAQQEFWSQQTGGAYEAPPPARGGMLPPPSQAAGPQGLGMPPGTPLAWEFPAAPRGFSEQALYGGPPSPPAPPPIVTQNPMTRPMLPPPSGPEVIPPRQFDPLYPVMRLDENDEMYWIRPVPYGGLYQNVTSSYDVYPARGAVAMDAQVGQRPPGMPIGYTPPPAGLLPPPSFIPAGPGQTFVGDIQQGVRPPGIPGRPVLQPTNIRQPIQPPQPAGLLPPPSFIPAGPSSMYVGDIQQGMRPPGMPGQFGQGIQDVQSLPMASEIPPPLQTMGSVDVRAIPGAQMPSYGGPSVIRGINMNAPAPANKFELAAEVNRLERMLKSIQNEVIALRKAGKNEEANFLRDNSLFPIINRNNDFNARLQNADYDLWLKTSMANNDSAADMIGEKLMAEAEDAIWRASQKKKALDDNPLKRLISEEGGFATPAGAFGAIASLPAATLGVLYRGMLVGGRGLRSALLSAPADKVINALQVAQDKLSQTLDIGALIGKSPALASAVASARTAPGAALSGIDSFLAARFPAVRAALDDIGRFTISNYGKPEAYLRMQAEAERIGRQAQDDLAGFGLRVVDAIGDDAARMERLYRDMTAEAYIPGSNAVDDALVQEGRDLTFRVGQLMNSVGALSDEALARWGQRYLPRTYEKHLKKAKEDGVTSMFARFFEDDPTLAGYYHRGTTEWVTDRQLRTRLASGQGWQTLPGPVRRDSRGNQLTRIWRDYTEAERDSWGELKNVAVALEKYARAARREVQNGTFLEGVRTGSDANGAWALDGTSLFGGGANRPKEFIDSTGQRYVYIGNNNRKGGPIKAYGTLADHYVRDDIAMHVRTANEFGAFKQTARLIKKGLGMNWWKKLVTIGNPAYFTNNFMVNMPMLELAGGSVADLPRAARMLAENTDPLLQQLRERGLIQDQMLLRQLSSRVAPVLEKAAAGPTATMSRFANIMGSAGNAVKRYENAAYSFAGASDDIYRTALVIGLMRRQGIKNIDEAVELANVAFYNRKNVNAPIVDMAESLIPFAGVTHWTLGSLPQLIYRNPHKAAVLASIAAAAPAATEFAFGIDPEAAEARRKMLPEQMRPGILPALGFPNAIFAGYDDKGQPIYIDTSTWNPINALTAEVPATTMGSLPRALSIGGIPAIVAQLYSNQNFYTGRPIVDYIESGGEKKRATIDNTLLSKIPGVGSIAPVEVRKFLGQALIPGVVRYPFEAARSALSQALPPEASVSMGLTSGESVPISLGTRAARMVGVKARPLNVAEAFARESGIKERSLSAVRKNQALTLRKYQRAIQNNNPAEAQAELKKYLEYELYQSTIEQEEARRMQQLTPALRPDR